MLQQGFVAVKNMRIQKSRSLGLNVLYTIRAAPDGVAVISIGLCFESSTVRSRAPEPLPTHSRDRFRYDSVTVHRHGSLCRSVCGKPRYADALGLLCQTPTNVMHI